MPKKTNTWYYNFAKLFSILIVCFTACEIKIVEDEKELISDFQAYFFQPKPEEIIKTKDNIEITTIQLGSYSLNNQKYHIATVFKLIPVAVGLRGNSTLLFISKSDTLRYEPNENLPIDIYKNKFVFVERDSSYIFTSISSKVDDLLCFDKNYNNQCFLRK